MDKKGVIKTISILTIIGVLIGVMLFVSPAQANYTYDNQSKTISLIGTNNKHIADIQLLTPLNNEVGFGYQRVAEFEIRGKSQSSNSFYGLTKTYDKKKYDKGERTELEREFDWKYLNITLVEEPKFYYLNLTHENGTSYTSPVQNGSHWVERERWVEFDKKLKTKEGENITIGLYTNVQQGDYVEWIPTFAGIEILEWATWEWGSIVIDDTSLSWTSSTTTARHGSKITMKGEEGLYIINMTKESLATPTTAYIHNAANTVQLSSVLFIGNVATFNFLTEEGQTYSITADSQGASYTVRFSNIISTPVSIVGTNLNWTAGIGNGDRIRNIRTVTTGLSINSSNTAPEVTATSSPDTLFTNTDYFVNLTVNDSDTLGTLTGYVQFYKNDIPLLGEFSENMTNATNIHVANLSSGNYTFGDVILAEYWAGDGTINTSKANHTTETVFTPLNISINHFDFIISDLDIDSATYVTIANRTFNFTSPKNVTFFGSGSLVKVTMPQSSDFSMRIIFNDVTYLDQVIRTVSGTGSYGVFTIPFIEVNASEGVNNISIEIKEEGNGAVGLRGLEIHVMINETNIESGYFSSIQTADFTFTSATFENVANFTLDKTGDGKIYMDVHHTISSDSNNDQVDCYLESNQTGETTVIYSRFLKTAGTTGSTGINLFSKNSTPGQEIQMLWCKDGASSIITNNVSILFMEIEDENGHTIQGFQNETSLTGLTNTNLIMNTTHTVQNGTTLEITLTTILQSTSGSQTPLIKINSTQPLSECSLEYNRTLDSNSDIGTVKIHANCGELTPGDTYDLTAWVIVEAGETLNVLNSSVSAFEVILQDTDIINTPPIVAILSPVNNSIISGNQFVNWTTTDEEGNNYQTNITLDNGTQFILASQLDQSISSFEFDSSTFEDGIYILTVLSYENDTAELFFGFENHTITINNIVPTIIITNPNTQTVTSSTMNLIVGIDETGSCNFSIDNGINQTMNPSIGTSFTKLISTPSNGNRLFTFYCSDLAGNENSSSITSFVNVVSGGGGGGGSSSSETITFVEKIFLNSIIISTPEFWRFDTENEVLIQTLDIDGNLTEVDSVDFIVDSFVGVVGDIIRTDVGKYKGKFTITNKSLTEFNITFVAKENDKFVNETIGIKLLKNKFLRKEVILKNLEQGIQRYKKDIPAVLFILGIIILITVILRWRKNK